MTHKLLSIPAIRAAIVAKLAATMEYELLLTDTIVRGMETVQSDALALVLVRRCRAAGLSRGEFRDLVMNTWDLDGDAEETKGADLSASIPGIKR